MMENKPIITCHGDQKLFSTLHPMIVRSLPKEVVEWKRSYGRPVRTIQVEANFVPFNPDIIPGEGDWGLLGRPFFHTYWTDCDIDYYKSAVKDDIAEWLSTLKILNVSDWMIIVIVNEESKMKAKLLRTSVVDKVKSDFCNKQTDRCAVLSDPLKHDLKTGESWVQLLTQMRQLMLTSYNNHLGMFEDYMRGQRERRNQQDWKFSNYFLLQEELAFMYEMLGLCEDALVQYDELDALFTQFVLNHTAGDTASWLSLFTKEQHCRWDGLCLSQPINIDKRQLVKRDQASLLDLRDYLFSRQATLLFLLQRPDEVANRSIAFLHNCVKELEMLNISMPTGSIACWVFLTCLEVLQSIDNYNIRANVGAVTTHSVDTASLWDYARGKMHALGLLCGLMPHLTPNTQQLAIVSDLVAGLTLINAECWVESKPHIKLKEALSSKENFRKHYLELSELAMGTYKHIGRLRSARIIGKYLAEFYMELGEPDKAEVFLSDAMKMYKHEGWFYLSDHTRLKLAECQRIIRSERYFRTCMHVASSSSLPAEIRADYQQQFLALARSMKDEYVKSKPVLYISSIVPKSDVFALHESCIVCLTLTLNLPNTLTLDKIRLTLVNTTEDANALEKSLDDDAFSKVRSRMRRTSRARARTASETSTNDVENMPTLYHARQHKARAPPVLEMGEKVERDSSDGVVSSGIVCTSEIKRSDSASTYVSRKESCAMLGDVEHVLSANDVELQPGCNEIHLQAKLKSPGTYHPHQLCATVSHLHMVKSLLQADVAFTVADPRSLIHIPTQGELYAGVVQKLKVNINLDGREVDDGETFRFEGGPGLRVLNSADVSGGCYTKHPQKQQDSMDDGRNEDCITCELHVHCALDKEQHVTRQLRVSCCWQPEETYDVTFTHPFSFSHKVVNVQENQFVHIEVSTTLDTEFTLSQCTLTCDDSDVQLQALHDIQQAIYPWIIDCRSKACCMWRISNPLQHTTALQVECVLTVQYTTEQLPNVQDTTHDITVDTTPTLYTVKTSLLPGAMDDRYKVSSTCVLKLHVQQCITTHDIHTAESDQNSNSENKVAAGSTGVPLLYKLDTRDTSWAVVGKSSGIIELVNNEYSTDIEVMPLVAGYTFTPQVQLLYQPTHQHTDAAMDYQPFNDNQVYNYSKASQVHVYPCVNTSPAEVIVDI